MSFKISPILSIKLNIISEIVMLSGYTLFNKGSGVDFS